MPAIFNESICVAPVNVLLPAIDWLPDVLTTVLSTANETAPVVPPPLKPSPAPTLSISPASLVKLITPVPLS